MLEWIAGTGASVVVAVLTVPYWLGPLVVRSRVKPLITPEIKVATELPEGLADAISRQETALAACGFRPAGHYTARTEVYGGTAVVSAMVGANDATLAVIAALPIPTGGWLEYVEFGTRFKDAGDVYIGNSPHPGIFATPPGQIKVQLPTIPDAAELWRIYRRVVEAHRAGVPARRVPAEGVEAAMCQGLQQAIAHQAEIGYFTRRDDEGCYQLNLWGAYRSSWLLMWPLKGLRARRHRREARLLLASIGEQLP